MTGAHRVSCRTIQGVLRVASLLTIFVASSFSCAAEPDLLPGTPNIWGVWLGTGGYPDVDPRYRNTPWPRVEFTPWGAAESKRISTPDTSDYCKPGGLMSVMAGTSLFPLEIARATKGLVLLFEPSPVPRRIYPTDASIRWSLIPHGSGIQWATGRQIRWSWIRLARMAGAGH